MINLYVFPVEYPVSGAPRYWRNETSGRLASAIGAFTDWRMGKAHAPNEVEIELLRAYCEHWIKAPVWRFAAATDKHALETQIEKAKTADALRAWLDDALEWGIDPL